MATKETLHRLIDELPDGEVDEAERYLRALQIEDPVLRSLELAPIDDEPLTPEEEAALQEGRDALARGEALTMEQLRRELGL
jgi:hypothetical protein